MDVEPIGTEAAIRHERVVEAHRWLCDQMYREPLVRQLLYAHFRQVVQNCQREMEELRDQHAIKFEFRLEEGFLEASMVTDAMQWILAQDDWTAAIIELSASLSRTLKALNGRELFRMDQAYLASVVQSLLIAKNIKVPRAVRQASSSVAVESLLNEAKVQRGNHWPALSTLADALNLGDVAANRMTAALDPVCELASDHSRYESEMLLTDTLSEIAERLKRSVSTQQLLKGGITPAFATSLYLRTLPCNFESSVIEFGNGVSRRFPASFFDRIVRDNFRKFIQLNWPDRIGGSSEKVEVKSPSVTGSKELDLSLFVGSKMTTWGSGQTKKIGSHNDNRGHK